MLRRTIVRARNWSGSAPRPAGATRWWRWCSAAGRPGLTRAGAGDLRRVPGVGRARAAQVLAAVELGRRTLVRELADRPRLSTPRQLAAFLLPQYGAHPVEQFGIVLLDTKHRLIRIRMISIGS